MNDIEFSVAHNVLWNINTTRYKFYQSIYQSALKDRRFDLPYLLEMGEKAGFTHNMSLDEITGCLYADFLIREREEADTFYITDRALSDFRIYNSDVKFKCCELPLTVDFTDSYMRLLTRPVDTMTGDKVEFLRKRGWSRNKSQITLIKKVKNRHDLETELHQAIPVLCRGGRYNGSFYELLKRYGRQRKYTLDYTANLNHRGNYASKTFFKYMGYYQAIFQETQMPIDWGGNAFAIDDIESLRCKNNDDFLSESFSDGMLRELTPKEKIKYQKDYTLTGHAHTIISSYTNDLHKKRLSMIIRPFTSEGKYELLMGINSLYSDSVLAYFKTHFIEYDQGWVICSELDIEQIIERIKLCCEYFISFDDKTIFDL